MKEVSPRSQAAFSLVEVVLAMGIVSFSVLATVGLLSVASQTGKTSRDEVFAAQIANNEFARLRSLSSSSAFWPATGLPTYATRYYDSNMADLGTTLGSNAIYALSINIVAPPTPVPADIILNAEVRYPANAAAANQSVTRFVTLINVPKS